MTDAVPGSVTADDQPIPRPVNIDSVQGNLRLSDYAEAMEWLFGRINYERLHSSTYSNRDFKLDRMRELLDRLGNPQSGMPVVHIAGTKGKGSTAVMVARILTAAGVKTGLYTSPHVTRFEERMTVDTRMPAEEELVDLVRQCAAAVAGMATDSKSTQPTFFEIATAIGWLYFRRCRAELVVLEVGLGGRLDSTNLCDPVICVITSISRDHVAILGDTVEQIAVEKSGIIKHGVPVVCGVESGPAATVIRSTAARHDCPFYQLGAQIHASFRPHVDSSSHSGTSQRVIGAGLADIRTPWRMWNGVQLPLAGAHQARNAALALTVIDFLNVSHVPITTEQAHAGLAAVRWPARIEQLGSNPVIIVDAAHNEASIAALVETLDQSFPQRPRTLIFAATGDKDIPAMTRILEPAFDHIVLTQYGSNPRGAKLGDLAEKAGLTATEGLHASATPTEALELARQLTPDSGLICVTGSFYLAAEMRDVLLPTATARSH